MGALQMMDIQSRSGLVSFHELKVTVNESSGLPRHKLEVTMYKCFSSSNDPLYGNPELGKGNSDIFP